MLISILRKETERREGVREVGKGLGLGWPTSLLNPCTVPLTSWVAFGGSLYEPQFVTRVTCE